MLNEFLNRKVSEDFLFSGTKRCFRLGTNYVISQECFTGNIFAMVTAFRSFFRRLMFLKQLLGISIIRCVIRCPADDLAKLKFGFSSLTKPQRVEREPRSARAVNNSASV